MEYTTKRFVFPVSKTLGEIHVGKRDTPTKVRSEDVGIYDPLSVKVTLVLDLKKKECCSK